jgi:hypothetical protein
MILKIQYSFIFPFPSYTYFERMILKIQYSFIFPFPSYTYFERIILKILETNAILIGALIIF